MIDSAAIDVLVLLRLQMLWFTFILVMELHSY